MNNLYYVVGAGIKPTDYAFLQTSSKTNAHFQMHSEKAAQHATIKAHTGGKMTATAKVFARTWKARADAKEAMKNNAVGKADQQEAAANQMKNEAINEAISYLQ